MKTESIGNGRWRATCDCGAKWETVGEVKICFRCHPREHITEAVEKFQEAKGAA